MKKIIVFLCVVFPNVVCAGDSDMLALFNSARKSCVAAQESMKKIQVLTGVSVGTSAVGTIGAGVALGTGIAKSKIDKQLSEMSAKELYEEADNLYTQLDERSKKLGNIRTGTIAVATVTSVTSAATTGVASNEFDNAITNLQDCQNKVESLTLAISKISDESVVKKIASARINCSGFDTENIKKIKNMSVANTVVSAVGATSGAVGTITSALSNTNDVRSDNDKKEKSLNTTANVMSGITTATSLTGTVLSGVTLSKLKNTIDSVDNCVKSF